MSLCSQRHRIETREEFAVRWIGIAEVIVGIPQREIVIVGEAVIESSRQVIDILRRTTGEVVPAAGCIDRRTIRLGIQSENLLDRGVQAQSSDCLLYTSPSPRD